MCCVNMLDTRHTIDNVYISNNCQTVAFVISLKLMLSIARETPLIKKMIKTIIGRRDPILKLEDDEIRDLNETIKRIKYFLKKTGHTFQKNIVRNETNTLVLEIADIYLQKINAGGINTVKQSRGEEILLAFLNLVFKHFKEQHAVAYYAEALRMTRGNLSRTVAAVSGKSPIQWMNNALVTEAKIMLHKPDKSVKQVADELNFADQSTFGKFFKKHTGMTPVEYRQKMQEEK